MSLIDNTYFIRGLSLAQLDQAAQVARLTQYQASHEPRFLEYVLGYSFNKLFQANLTDARFVALKNGAEYTYNDVTGKWKGFSNAEKVSPIANYIFYYWLKDDAEKTVGIGVAQSQAENATMSSPRYLMLSAWNEMIYMVKSMNTFLAANAATYPEYKQSETKQLCTDNQWGL